MISEKDLKYIKFIKRFNIYFLIAGIILLIASYPIGNYIKGKIYTKFFQKKFNEQIEKINMIETKTKLEERLKRMILDDSETVRKLYELGAFALSGWAVILSGSIAFLFLHIGVSNRKFLKILNNSSPILK